MTEGGSEAAVRSRSGMGVTRRLGNAVNAPTTAQSTESPQLAHTNRVLNRAVMPGSIVRLRRRPVEVARRQADRRLTAITHGGPQLTVEVQPGVARSASFLSCRGMKTLPATKCEGGLDE